MFKHIYAIFLFLSLFLFAIACSESANLKGSSITGIPDNSSTTTPGGGGGGTISGPTDNGTHNGQEDIPPVLGNAPDDQTPDSNVNSDFSNPINMVGRYKINAVKIVNPDGITTLETTAANDDLKGAFAVNPQVKSTISIDIGIKLQFHPDIVKKYELHETIAYVNKKFNKPVDISGGLNFDKIFKDLGAAIDGKTVYFTLTPPDMPLGNGFSITLTLEKVSNKADFGLVNDPRKYWVTAGEPEEPVEPENPGTDDNGTVPPEPELPPSDGTVTNIDINVPSTLTGHYKITRFITFAASTTIDSATLEKIEGEIALVGSAAAVEAISKMQMKADVFGMTENDKYNYTVYEPFTFSGSNLVSTTNNEYKYSSATITKKSDKQIEIKQYLKKNAPVIGVADVEVTVIATKISDTPKPIIDCGYWDANAVKACKEDGSAAVTNIDPTNKDTFLGSYSLSNYGMEYQRPAGGQFEQIWAKVAILDGIIYEGELLIKKLDGTLSIKKDSDGKLATDFKAQVDVPYQTQKEYQWGDFNDPRWRFFREIDVKEENFSVSTTANKNELAIKVTRTFSYRYFGFQHNVETYISFIVQKQSDEPQEVTNDKYWETSEPAIIVPNMSDPRTLTGHYKLTNIGHAYSRPNSVGSTWEDNWATNPTVMTNLQGELSFVYNGTDIKTSNIHAKYQIDSTMYIYYSDGMLVRTDFSDPRWKFFNEEFNNNYSVELEGNNIKVCKTRQFEYRFWKVEWLAWNNHWETRKPDVNVCFVGEKIADEPQEINGNKYR